LKAGKFVIIQVGPKGGAAGEQVTKPWETNH
jgi:hypothetical protein